MHFDQKHAAEKFNRASQPKRLYHSIPGEPEGGFIRPSSNYGAYITPDMWRQLGLPPQAVDTPDRDKVPLVFAATHLGKSLAFSFPKDSGVSVSNGTIEGTGGPIEYKIVADRERAMSMPLNSTVYAVPSEGFADFKGQHQRVSPRPVPFADAEVVLKINSTHDLMKAGLQIFSFKENYGEKIGGFETLRDMINATDLSTPQTIARLLQEKVLVWENKDCNVNPDPRMAKSLGIDLSQPKSAYKLK